MTDIIDSDTGEIKYALRSGTISVVAYDSESVSRETGLSCAGSEDMAQQQFREECDINEIVRRFGLTGELPENVKVPRSGDFTDVIDYQTAMEAVAKANSDFMELPAELRAQFENSPQKLLEFMEDGRNLEKARELGLVNKPVEKPRDVVTAVDELSKKFDNGVVGSSTAKKE